MSFQTKKTSSCTLQVSFSGRLDTDTVANIWDACFEKIAQEKFSKLILDCKNVNYCDSSGVALLQTLQKKPSTTIKNLDPKFKQLLDYIESKPNKIEHANVKRKKFPESVGEFAQLVSRGIQNNIIFIGGFFIQLFISCMNPKNIRWRDLWRVTEDTGHKALPIIILIGFLIGLISTFQAAPTFEQFGVQIYLVNLAGLGLVREMGPLMTAVLLAGRTASSFAAELGTMKINQEIDALTTMGLSPIRFLVVPRVLATVIMTPLACVFFIFFGLVGCFTVMLTLGYPLDAFLHQLYDAVQIGDCIGGLIKIFVFGWVIACIGCMHGLKTRFGAQAVGASTTRAVVSSLIMLVIVDGIFAVIYYVLNV